MICLNEWEYGYEIKTAFTDDQYESVYEAIVRATLRSGPEGLILARENQSINY
jgi:hypothetical protein